MSLEENTVPNHLINEKSPYLLQHAHNPVGWYPWSTEAFTRARAEDKPIFLSIGYSTCHWCHVMAHESFESLEVADFLNAHFISIKVDKEERPDIDTIYMNVCQRMTGHGGWPLTILMTPDQKPFFAGTYLPIHSKHQMFGLMELLQNVQKLWTEDKSRLQQSAEDIFRILKQDEENSIQTNTTTEDEPNEAIFQLALQQFEDTYDQQYAGFGDAPKFPTLHNLLFLLRMSKLINDDYPLRMVKNTLDAMYRGGIYDHIGGGFARYSTDERWLVPHFEKMLYDNALLVIAYTEAYQVLKKPLYRMIVEETLSYIMTEMTDDQGGFYCAQDADSEGEEGKYYTFTPDEVIHVLGKNDGEAFNQYYDITKRGNFEGRSIPNRLGKELHRELSKELNKEQDKSQTNTTKDEFQNLKTWKQKLYEYRKNRMSLHKDDKILTSWNGLMITAFAKAYQVFGKPEYLTSAKTAYQWIEQNHRDEQGRLMVRYRDGHIFGTGNLDDYAYTILAQITLYEVTSDPTYLQNAKNDADKMIEYFFDDEHGGFYFYGNDVEKLILRPKEVYDGAMPSGNSVAMFVLAKLDKITRDERISRICGKQMRWLYGMIKDVPYAYAFALCGMLIEMSEFKEIVCVLKDEVEREELRQLMQKFYLPDAAIVPVEPYSWDSLGEIAPYTKEYKRSVDQAEIFICENFTCHPPLKGMEAFFEYLKNN